MENQIDPCHARVCDLIEERFNKDVVTYCVIDLIQSVKNTLNHIASRISDEKMDQYEQTDSNSEDPFVKLLSETGSICKIGSSIQSNFTNYAKRVEREKRELEIRVLGLTEENRDLSRLLRKSKTGEEKRGAIMQIAQTGLRKVGFGFVMGVLSGGTDSDASDKEEDNISLSEEVERIMKNLRNEIDDLRRALQESRSITEEFQALVEEQGQKLKENETRIKAFEEQEILMFSTIEELKKEITMAGEEINRWKEACELEVEAGKSAIKERNKELALLQHELDQTTKSLESSTTKLHIKQQLAARAMAAQSAAAACLRLADSRSASLTDRIEELTRQLEECEEEKWRSKRRQGRVCWNWKGIGSGVGGVAVRVAGRRGRSVNEMEALLRIKI